MALDENQNENFDRIERIMEGHIVWIKKNIQNYNTEVPALVVRIYDGSENPIKGKQLKTLTL